MADTAVDLIKMQLDDLGLGSMAQWAWDKVLAGEQWPQIYQELRQTTEYKAIYPAMEELSKQGRAISEGQYRAYTQDIREQASYWGIPMDMYGTPQGIAKMMLNGVSSKEASERFQMAAAGASTAPQEVKDAFQNLYGLSGGDLIATYLDADKAEPMLTLKYQAAQIAGASYLQQTAADVQEAERLASQGVSFDQAVRGYGQAKVSEGLDYAGGLATTRADRVAAQFGDAQAAQRVQQATQARQAAFQAGGGLAASQEGVGGLSRSSA